MALTQGVYGYGGGFIGVICGGEGGGGREGLGATGILTQEENPGGTTLVDAGNGFNNLIRLAMIWTVRHRWSMG